MLLQKMNCFKRTTLHYENTHYANPRVYGEQTTKDLSKILQKFPYTVKNTTKIQRAQSLKYKNSENWNNCFPKGTFFKTI